MSLTVKIILVVSLVLIGSHLLLWGFIKRKLREAEARIAKDEQDAGTGGASIALSSDSGADCGDGGGCD